MAAAKDVTHQDLAALPKRQLIEETLALAGKLKSIKDKAKEKVVEAAEENADYMAAAAGAAAAGYALGMGQKDTDADPEGVDHTTILGVDKDLALGLGLAGASYFKQAKKYKPHLRQGGIGAMSFYIGRKTYDSARKPDEETSA